MITLVCIPKFWFSSKIRDLIYHVGVGFLEISKQMLGKTGVVSLFHCSSYSWVNNFFSNCNT